MEIHYFTASWCAGCKQIKPLIEKVHVPVITHDVDMLEGQQVAYEYDVQSLPTVLAVEDGLVLWGHSGMTGELLEKLKALQWAS